MPVQAKIQGAEIFDSTHFQWNISEVYVQDKNNYLQAWIIFNY